MHPTAMFFGQRFFEAYCSTLSPTIEATGLTIIEIGSQNVNGSLRQVAPQGAKYIGLDFVEGAGVDVVLSDPYVLPLPDDSTDVVVCSSCFEHSQFFWLVFLEIIRILKPGGVFYLNAPSNGYFHRWPVDCWRFYPDSGHALVAWGKRNGMQDLMLLESFIGLRSTGDIWNDFVAVFLKDEKYLQKYPRKMTDKRDIFVNGYSGGNGEILNHGGMNMPDLSLLISQTQKINALSEEVRQLKQKLAEITHQANPSLIGNDEGAAPVRE
jgi:SAM-dependent methyltransferase